MARKDQEPIGVGQHQDFEKPYGYSRVFSSREEYFEYQRLMSARPIPTDEERDLLLEEGYSLTGDPYEAEIYYEVRVLGLPYEIVENKDGSATIELIPSSDHKKDSRKNPKTKRL